MESTYGGSNRGVAREQTPDVLPASQFLQEKLLERRQRNTRPKRTRQSDFGPRTNTNVGRDDDIFLNEAEENRSIAGRGFDSSPVAPMTRKESEGSGSKGRVRALGAKGLDEHMDRLTKQNFALKLELDHRRGHTAKLQEQISNMREQIEWAEQMKDEHTELLRINSQLVEELEKRDKAIEEAMDIICDLEDRNAYLGEQVNDFEERNSNTRPSTANADSGYAGTETHEQVPPSSPPELAKAPKTPHVARRASTAAAQAATGKMVNFANGVTPARTRREPHILSQKKASTHALRSVYLETAQSLHPVKSFNSLLTRREESDEDAVLDSPRLSVLSEGSFSSIYNSPKKQDQVSPDKYAWEEEEPAQSPTHWRQDSIKRVSQWMDEHERDQADDTPSKSNRISPPINQQVDEDISSSPSKRPGDEARFQSLANAISVDSPASASAKSHRGVSYIKPYPIRTDRKAPSLQPRPISFGGPMFGEPLLPPTPDSASTRMLRGSSSTLGERSLLDTTPGPVRGYDALEPGVRTAPQQFRSSMELNAAYQSYVQRRQENHFDEAIADDDVEPMSEGFRDLSLDYDGFPDGDSIIVGTPSRFLKHSKAEPAPSPYPNLASIPRASARSPLARRQSSSEATVSPRKPSINRAETSPSMIPSFGSVYQSAAKPAERVMSPRSHDSGSSSNRTVVQSDRSIGAISPELPPVPSTEPRLPSTMASPPRSRSRASPSPAPTLSQRTHRIFRRLSNNRKDTTDNTPTPTSGTNREREKSPLPTLTSAPSSVYVNDVPKEVRRPGTSYSNDAASNIPRPPSSTDGYHQSHSKRPSLPQRTKTAPTSPGRPRSASKQDQATPTGGKGGLFKRRGSVQQKAVETPPPPPSGSHGGAGSATGARRRDSIRDTVVNSVGRRPWRG